MSARSGRAGGSACAGPSGRSTQAAKIQTRKATSADSAGKGVAVKERSKVETVFLEPTEEKGTPVLAELANADQAVKLGTPTLVDAAVAEQRGGFTNVHSVAKGQVRISTAEIEEAVVLSSPGASPKGTPQKFSLGTPRTGTNPVNVYQAVTTANTIVLKLKDALESRASGNLKKEIREMVVAGLGTLLEIILTQSDSRQRAILEAEKLKAARVRDMDILRQGHAAAMERHTARYEAFESRVEDLLIEVRSEVKATRLIVGHYDQSLMPEQMAEIKTIVSQATEKMTGPQTYSGIVAGPPIATLRAPEVRVPTHSIVISSLNKKDTSDDVLTNFRNVVDARSSGLKVDKVRKARHQRVVVSCSDARDISVIKGKLRDSEAHLTVQETTHRNPLVVIRNVLAYNTDDHILESLKNQNKNVMAGLTEDQSFARVKFRRKCRNTLVNHIILEVAPALWGRLISVGFVHIDLQRRCVLDQSPLLQCTRCLGFGHSRRFCKETEDACSHCAGLHLRSNCAKHRDGNPPACRNCLAAKLGGLEHDAFSEDCPVRKKWDELARQKIKYC